MSGLKDKMTSKEFQDGIKHGIIQVDKKKLKYVEPLSQFKAILDSEGVDTRKGSSSLKKPMINKKIKNAKKEVINGIKFDSSLERYMYNMLTSQKIKFEFQRKFVLVKGFRYKDKAILPITWKADFVMDQYNIIIDAKGFPNDVFPVKMKLFKRMIFDTKATEYEILLPSNRKECDSALIKVLNARREK